MTKVAKRARFGGRELAVLLVMAGVMPALADATKTAYWTGGGDRANVNDPANWVVTNSLGVVVENGIPDVETAVVISGETDFNCPVGQTLAYEAITIGDCTLTADCDWRGLVLRPSPAYIDVPKDAYIDTDFKPNQDTRVVMDVTVQGGREYWFGCWNSAYNRGAFAVGNDKTEVYVGFGNNGGGKFRPQLPNGRCTIDFDKGVLSTNGVLAVDMGAQTFQVNHTLYLFAQNRIGTAVAWVDQGTIRFHSCQIYDNGTLVRDYVPTNNGVAFGLYDRVNGTFSTSANASVPFSGEMKSVEINGTVDLAGHSLNLADTAGTGTITDSSAYLDVPKGYYFNTGFRPNQDTRVVMDVLVQMAGEYWCGAWDTGSWSDRAFSFCNDGTGVYTAFVKKGSSNNGTKGAVVPNGRHVLDFDKGVFKVDGETHTDRSAGDETYQWNNSLYLFAQNRTGTAKFHDNQGTIRLYSCQIYTNDILVCDYVPAKSATAFGLYDKVGGTFRALDGSGTGSAGGVVAAGELHIDVSVPVVENTSLEIAGALTLVKDGRGTFMAAKAGQSYVGGTVVSNGLAKSGVGFAPWGSAKSLVTVADGAAFDWAGVHSIASTPYSFAIKGDGPDGTGSLLNSVAVHAGDCWRSNCIGDLYLNGDAMIGGCVVFGFTLAESYTSGSYKHALALNDHTLSIWMRSDNRTITQQFFAFRGVQAISGGKIVFSKAEVDGGVTNSSYVSFYTIPSDLNGVTLEIQESTSVNVEQPPAVGTFIDGRSVAGYDYYPERTTVILDVFKPLTTNLLGTVTLGDATHLSPVLDLSALDGPFVLPASEFALGAAEGATVRVNVGARKVTSKTPIISWTTSPAGVSFAWPDGTPASMGSLVAKDDGLYAVTGFMIWFR